jgi:hypothetical protein
VEISLNTKTRLQVMTWSLVFVLMLISIRIDQNPKFFSCMCWRRMFCFSAHSPREKYLTSFPFKVVLSWKQCSCDVIIERVYCKRYFFTYRRIFLSVITRIRQWGVFVNGKAIKIFMTEQITTLHCCWRGSQRPN